MWALLISFGANLSIGTVFPRKFHICTFCKLLALSPMLVYTSLNLCKQLALSSSKFTYNTRPCAHSQLSHFLPSAMAMAISISAKLFPALEGPAISILWPCLSTPLINSGAKSGMSSQKSSKFSGSGKSSFKSSIYSNHSSQLCLPMLVSIKNCLRPFRTTPGIRLNREGFLF